MNKIHSVIVLVIISVLFLYVFYKINNHSADIGKLYRSKEIIDSIAVVNVNPIAA
jgi:competence protein ComGC